MRLLMLLVLCLNVVSIRAEDTVALEKDQKAPFTGILFSSDKAKSLKNELLDKDNLDKQVEIYKANDELLNQQVDMWRKQSERLTKELTKEKNSFWSNLGFFVLGSGITVGIAYAVRRATK